MHPPSNVLHGCYAFILEYLKPTEGPQAAKPAQPRVIRGQGQKDAAKAEKAKIAAAPAPCRISP